MAEIDGTECRKGAYAAMDLTSLWTRIADLKALGYFEADWPCPYQAQSQIEAIKKLIQSKPGNLMVTTEIAHPGPNISQTVFFIHWV